MKFMYLLIFIIGVLFLKATFAEEVNFDNQSISTEDAISALNPSSDENETKPTARNGASRSLFPMNNAMPSLEVKPKHYLQNKTKQAHGLSMRILFGLNSAELNDDAKHKLKPIGEAMASEKLMNLKFVIEGHTDAQGDFKSNKLLSQKRAGSVSKFLSESYNLDSQRFKIVGRGESSLLDPKHPNSEQNRRVKILTLK